MEQVQFNQENYNIEIKLSRINDDGDFVNDVALLQDNISEFQIVNDLSHPLLRCMLFLKDPGSHVSPKYAMDGRTFLNVKIYYTTNQKSKDPKSKELLQFEHNFIVNDVQIVDKTADEGIYRFLGVSEMVVSWLNKTYYSTHNQPHQITKIIGNIFQNSALNKKFKYYASKNDFIHSTHSSTFITPVNHSLQDCIFPLLIASHNVNTGIYILPYNMLMDKLLLMSVSDEFKNNIIPDGNGIQLPSKLQFAEMESMPKDEKMFNFIRSINQYERVSQSTLNNFDYINRKWSKDIFSTQKLNKILPNTNDKLAHGNFKSLFKPNSDRFIETKFNYEEVSNFPFILNTKMEEYFKFAQIMQFSTTGFLKRDVGQLFQTEAHPGDTYDNRESGTWMISRVHHIFSKESYDQNISLIRSDKKIEEFKNKVQT